MCKSNCQQYVSVALSDAFCSKLNLRSAPLLEIIDNGGWDRLENKVSQEQFTFLNSRK